MPGIDLDKDPQLMSVAAQIGIMTERGMNAAEKLMRLGEETDVQVMKQPNPHRMRNFGVEDMVLAAYGEAGLQAFEMGISGGKVNAAIVSMMMDFEPMRRWLTNLGMSAGDSNTNLGVIDNTLTPFRFWKTKGRFFQLTPALRELLLQTDISRNLPTSFIRPPYECMYFDFNATEEWGVPVHNPVSGDHIMEGVYITSVVRDCEDIAKVTRDEMKLKPGKIRVMDLLFCGSPLGKANVLDDATCNISLYIHLDSDETIDQMLTRHFSVYGMDRIDTLYRGTEFEDIKFAKMSDEAQATFAFGIEMVTKALLYVNSENFRFETNMERTELEEKIARTKPKKRGKLEKRLSRVYDRIVIGPTSVSKEENYFESTKVSGARAIHWRRGHYRNQRFGEGWKESKIIWIEPTLISGAGELRLKDYKVK